jgi:DNA-binding transcriptional LysR family regulator
LLCAGGFSVKRLPIDLRDCISPLSIITLKDRVLNPVAQRFIEHIRAHAAKDLPAQPLTVPA